VTDAEQIQAAGESVESLDILVNNAGVAMYDDLSDRALLEQHLAVNLFGTYVVTQAFLPLLTRSRGAIVNVLSNTALAALPLIPAYSISNAAAFSLSQSLRALLAGRGVKVHAVLAGLVDTDMSRGLDAPKAPPESVARAIFDGVENGEDEIFPDPCRSGWGTAGAAGPPRRSSVSTRPSSTRRPSRDEQAAKGSTATRAVTSGSPAATRYRAHPNPCWRPWPR
jgi:NAD(P)-dependent dehydrogenase (short-subunit alcohol dehydrogenase family)